MDHLDLAGVLTTPPQWNVPAFEQQDAIYLSSSRQMLEPIMEETSDDEEYALNSWQQHDQQESDAEGGCTTEGDSSCGGTGGAGGASFWSSAESDTGSVIRIEVTKDNDSTSERDFLCPAKRPRRCEESLASSLPEEEVILRRPLYAGVEKNNSLERFLNYENFSRDSWGTNSQQRSSMGSRRGFDDFYSDSDSLSYNSLSRSSSLIQFESLERQLLMQEQHASMTSLGNSSPSLLSFDTHEESQTKAASNSGNNSANNSRRGSQSSLLKKYESLDGRLHQTYYDLDKLNFDDMNSNNSSEQFSRVSNLKISTHLAEIRSDSESSSEGSEGSSRPQSVLSPIDCTDNEFLFKKFNKSNSQQVKKGKSSAENLSEDSGYCEPSLGFGLRRSKSQSLLKNYEKFSEEEEELENKSLISSHSKQTFNELNSEQQQKQQQQANKHSMLNEFKNNTTTRHECLKTPPLSPHLDFIRHKQRTETHSPSPVSSEVSTSSSSSQSSTNSNNSSSSSASSSTSSSATTCASKASFTWLMATSRVQPAAAAGEEENPSSQISINDLRELKTSPEENVQISSGKSKNNFEKYSPTRESYVLLTGKDNECLECKNILEKYELSECRNCGEQIETDQLFYAVYLSCQKCNAKTATKNENFKNSEINLNCKNCGEQICVNLKLTTGTLGEKVRKKIIEQQLQLITEKRVEVNAFKSYENKENSLESFNKFNSSCSSSPESCKSVKQNFPFISTANSSSDSDYSPLGWRKNHDNLMPSWPFKTSSVPNELHTLGRQKIFKKSVTTSSKQSAPGLKDNDSLSSNEELDTLDSNIKRSVSWSFQEPIEAFKPPSLCIETNNLGLLHQSYHNLALLNLELDQQKLKGQKMTEKRVSSDYETEIVCTSNFLLDELSAHFDRTSSLLNDKPIDETDAAPVAPQRLHQRKSSNSSCSAGEENENEQVQHVQLVIRKPPARQKRHKEEGKTNSFTQNYSFASIMQNGGKTFDQDPTILRTSYAQSLEKCNFDCKELSTQDVNKARSIPKRRFQSQANNAKKKNLVSSTPNLNAYDFNHQDEIEDDIFVSSAHNSMHQLPLSQTQKPLGILVPAGSRTSFGKEVSFCPVVSKYCWQEQSSEECHEETEEGAFGSAGEEESEDELLDNADATVIYNTKENENIASKYNEEFLKKKHENNKQQETVEIVKEKVVVKEINNKQQVENVVLLKEATEKESVKQEKYKEFETQQENNKQRAEISNTLGEQAEKETLKIKNIETTQRKLLPVTAVSLTTNVNNETLKIQSDGINTKQNKSVNNYGSSNTILKASTQNATVARPLSIQLPILSEPPINRAHHILYASQQMLDNFQRQKEHEEHEHYKSQSTQNLSKMSHKNGELQTTAANPKLNNNNEIMKTKFKHEEKHPNSKGFLSRFTNGFRFSLRRNKKKLQQKENLPQGEENTLTVKTNGLAQQNKSKSLPAASKQADFIHIPLKGPLPERSTGSTYKQIANNGNAKNTTVQVKQQKGAKTKDANDKQKKVTGKPPIPPQQQQLQQHMQKLQSAQSSLIQQQQQQQPLVEVGLSRFYTETDHPPSTTLTQDFLTSERGFYNNQQQSCANNQLENVTEMTAVNTNNTAAYEFTSPSRASVSQKTQMFNNLSRKSEQPKIGLIETNLDTHETIITGKTRSLINIGPNQLQPHQQRFAGNKRLHTTNNTNTHSNHLHHHDGNDGDDDGYDDNDEVVVRPDGTVVVIKNAGTNGGSSSSQAAQIVSVRRPHKSMEFLLDKENQKDVMTTSEDSQTELKIHEFLNDLKPLRKRKSRRCLTLNKENKNRMVKTSSTLSTDSDSDFKYQNANTQNSTLPTSKKCSDYVKKLVVNTLKISKSLENPGLTNSDLNILEFEKSLLKQVNSPSKFKNAYTLTVMTTPSPHTESDFCDSDLPRTPIKETSRSCPSLVEAELIDVSKLKNNKLNTKDSTDGAKVKQQVQQNSIMDSFIDQGFETGSNATESPLRLPRKACPDFGDNFVVFDNVISVQHVLSALRKTAQPYTLNTDKPTSSSISVNKTDTTLENANALHYTSCSPSESDIFSHQDYATNQSHAPLDKEHTGYSSQFWITLDNFTISFTIHHYDSERLQLLRGIYVQKSLECCEINFGIDDHKFCLNRSCTTDNNIFKMPKKDNCSQFWFSAGDVLISFSGKQMSSNKIQAFFNYIRQYRHESIPLRFGIDDYEFSTNCQQTEFGVNPYGQAVSPQKTSDLDQTDIESDEFEKTSNSSASDGNYSNTVSLTRDDLITPPNRIYSTQPSSSSLGQTYENTNRLNLSKSVTNKPVLATQFTVSEMLEVIKMQQNKLQFLYERIGNCVEAKDIKIFMLLLIQFAYDVEKKLENIQQDNVLLN